MFTVLLLMGAGADPAPKFIVENKTTPTVTYTVENKAVAPALPTDENQPAPDGYQWVKRGDGPWKLEPNAPGVAVPKGATFQQQGRGDGHQCPACGRSQYVVDSFNRDGSHNHRCALDGTVWTHK